MTPHDHELEDDATYGIPLGFRIVEDGGHYYLAEAEIAPYVDEPDELGVTLVFHPLDGINPAEMSDEAEWPAWPVDIDDDLERSSTDPMDKQFAAIVRQLHDLDIDRLRFYLNQARDEAEMESDEF
jgi:hypothetical protein